MADPVRVRFAPSPTGLLHIGGLRTALYNWLFARRHGGAFVLRIEDTDRSRYVPEAEADIVGSLRWAGLDVDEGPNKGGPHGPYYQSERRALYAQHARRLVEAGHAYYAFDTPEELDAMRARRRTDENPTPTYDATTRMEMQNSLALSEDEVQRRLDAGEDHVIRLKVPPGEAVGFEDRVRGAVRFETDALDDQVLVKSDGMPTYHLANVVDDHEMAITHVIRGEEWLPSVPKHLLLYRFLGWEPPAMAHLPLLLSPSGGKLSKRKADVEGVPVFVCQYRGEGACPEQLVGHDAPRLPVEPEALVNYLAFLGWNPGTEQELFTLDELVEAFSVERVGKAGVQLDLDKLQWYHQQYFRQKPLDELVVEARRALEEHGYRPDETRLRAVVALMRERITSAEELATVARYFWEDPKGYEERGVQKRWKADSAELLRAYAGRIEQAGAFDAETLEAELRALAEERGAGAGRVIHPTRLAVTGVTAGAGLFETMEVVGREACLRRLRRAVEVLA